MAKKKPEPPPVPQPDSFRRMVFAVMRNEEAQRLVAAWPFVDHALPKAALRRQWMRIAHVRPHAWRIFEEGLARLGLILPGGKVHPEVEQIVAVLSLSGITKGAKR